METNPHQKCKPIHLGETDEGRLHWWWCEKHGEHVATTDRTGAKTAAPLADDADNLTGFESTR